MSPLVPEFTQKSGRDAFVANHQMPPFEKADWKGNADMAIETKYTRPLGLGIETKYTHCPETLTLTPSLTLTLTPSPNPTPTPNPTP